jgi:O-methyltransferase
MLIDLLNWLARGLIRLALLLLMIPHVFGGNKKLQATAVTSDASRADTLKRRTIVEQLQLLRHPGTLLRFEALRSVGRIVLPEYRFRWPQIAWWHNADFNAYLQRFKEIDGMNTDHRWMLGQLMRLTEDVPGDTAECGVFEGAGSYLICTLNRMVSQQHRIHHVFDSFEGLSSPEPVDGSHWTKGDLACGEEVVSENLREFAGAVVLHKGWIPERFPDIQERRFSFVHIDVDLYQPTLDSVRFFYPRMNAGGVIVCDDYGFTSCPGATQAIDAYLADKPEKMLSLSCGAGFLIKGCPTAPPLGG